MQIICIPHKASLHYCLGCNSINFFDGNAHCYYCGSDSPEGELYHPDEDCLNPIYETGIINPDENWESQLKFIRFHY